MSTPENRDRHEDLDVLAFLAIANNQADRSLVVHAFHKNEQPVAFESIQQAKFDGLIKESGLGVIRFVSDDARDRTIDHLSGEQLAIHHLAVAQAIESRDGADSGKSMSAVARHLVAAIPLVDPIDAARRCLIAGNVSLDNADLVSAADLLELGLDLTGRDRTSRLKADLLSILGQVQRASIRIWNHEPVVKTFEAAMAAYVEIGDIDAALRIASIPIPATHGRDTTVEFLETAVELAEERGEYLIDIRTRLARAYLLERGDQASAVRQIEAAIKGATSLDRDDLLLRALAARAFISAYSGDISSAERDGSHVLANAVRDPERIAELDACETMVNVCLLRGDLSKMFEIGGRMVAAGEWTGNPEHAALGEMVRGRTKLSAANLRAAVEHLEESNRLQPNWLIPIELLARIAFLRDEQDKFDHWIGKLESLQWPERTPGRAAIGFSQSIVWATHLIDLGTLTGNHDLIDRARLITEPPILGTGTPFPQMAAMEPAAQLAIIDGDDRLIIEFAHEYGKLYQNDPPWMFLKTAALLAYHSGNRTLARRMLRKGIRYGDRRGICLWTLEIAETLLQISTTNRALPSDNLLSIASWGSSLADKIGVVNGIDNIRETLRKRPRSSYGQNPATGLTPRQHEVLTLMSKGMTNKEIAAEVFLHPYTVDTHVRNIFLKLGVSNRSAAVSKWADLGSN